MTHEISPEVRKSLDNLFRAVRKYNEAENSPSVTPEKIDEASKAHDEAEAALIAAIEAAHLAKLGLEGGGSTTAPQECPECTAGLAIVTEVRSEGLLSTLHLAYDGKWAKLAQMTDAETVEAAVEACLARVDTTPITALYREDVRKDIEIALPLLTAKLRAEVERLREEMLAHIREYQAALLAHDADERKTNEELRTATDQLDYIEGFLKDAGFFFEGDSENTDILKREVDDRAGRAIKYLITLEARIARLTALVESAYCEGYEDGGGHGGNDADLCWPNSKSAAALSEEGK